MKAKPGQVTQEGVLTDTGSTESTVTEVIFNELAQSDAVNLSTPGILGTPLLYKVNANTTGHAVAIQNTFTHTLAAHGIFGGGQALI